MNAPVVDPTYRPLGLESDLANQNFAGARNPDDLLWVKFYMKAVPDNYQSELQKRPIFRDEVWVEIRTPGNNLLTIETPADDTHKIRFARHWALFQQTHRSDGQSIGTPIEQWALLRPSQVQELKAIQFFTVEQIANAPDGNLQNIGMIAGMGWNALRDKARQYLHSAQMQANAAEQEAKEKALTDALAAEKAAREESEKRHTQEMAEMKALLQSLANPPRNKGGRPRKVKPPEAPTGA